MRSNEYKRRFKIAAYTEKWAMTMTKVRIRQAMATAPFPCWHLLTFTGRDGGESRGVVDLIAIRKDHGAPRNGTKRGDCFQIILIQVKGGSAARFFALRAKGNWVEIAGPENSFSLKGSRTWLRVAWLIEFEQYAESRSGLWYC